jgi:hypothetical protein
MNTQHTPGPWQIWAADDSVIDVAVGPSIGGVAVCQIVTSNGIGIHTAEATERGAANAALIAAAPDLLEALEEMVKAFNVYAPKSVGGEYNCVIDARAAIAKAAGGQA